jgi:hypothetical protein
MDLKMQHYFKLLEMLSLEKRRGAHMVLEGKPERRRQLERTRCRWEDSIKMELREVDWGSMDWINLVQDRDRWQVF